MKYIVNLTHINTGKGKVRSVQAEDMKGAIEVMRERYPEYEVGRIHADQDSSLKRLYKEMKKADRQG